MTTTLSSVTKIKKQPLLKSVLKVGVSTQVINMENIPIKKSVSWRYRRLKQLSKRFILFDWEFNSNELEYE
ncbi:MAG: hypothetical protein RL596_34 [Bacteroidota bacterium]|jgi:hypothetical protein